MLNGVRQVCHTNLRLKSYESRRLSRWYLALRVKPDDEGDAAQIPRVAVGVAFRLAEGDVEGRPAYRGEHFR